MKRSERKQWERAKSLEELGEMTNRWLDGEVQETPGHMGPPDEETAEIREDLKRFNRNGYVTAGSQPGIDWTEGWDGRPWTQRAFVEGYADPDVAARIERAARESRCEHEEHADKPAVTTHRQRVSDMPSMWNRAQRREDRESPAEAVTMRGDHVNTAVPPRLTRGDYDSMWSRGVSADAYDALGRSEWVTAVDNHWGASRSLWDTVGNALDPERER